MQTSDFDMRQVRIVEMLARRIAYVLQNAYDPATGLLTRPAFEQRALAVLGSGERRRSIASPTRTSIACT